MKREVRIMEIITVYAVYFSATGRTRKVVTTLANAIAQTLELPLETVDFTLPAAREETYAFTDKDLVIFGTPTYAGDLALALFSIVEGGYYAGREGSYHFTDEGACSWYDFAVEIARTAGPDTCRIEPCRTADYPTRALRPAYSLLDKSKGRRTVGLETPHWRESTLYCLMRLKKNNG